jgi:hypothetical protein
MAPLRADRSQVEGRGPSRALEQTALGEPVSTA